MPKYYFHLCDDEHVLDHEGTDLTNVGAAREHASAVARELTWNTIRFLDQNWSEWTMKVQDGNGVEMFTLAMSDFSDDSSEK